MFNCRICGALFSDRVDRDECEREDILSRSWTDR